MDRSPGSHISCQDWRTVPAHDIAPLLDDEIEAWRRDLGWDVRESWRQIEPARAAGTLPGIVVRDADGRIGGWTCFLEHHGSLQVAALASSSADASRALADAIFASDVAARTSACVWCVRDGSPGLAGALAARGCAVTRYLYLATPAVFHPSANRNVRRWRDDDEPRIADLCGRAYGAIDQVRAFAPHGTMAEWKDYVHGLRHTPGCGRFLPLASLVALAHGVPIGATVVTGISPEVAHLAQIVVDPAAQRQGWGRRLLGDAIGAVRRLGYLRLTLLVAEDNVPARRLYRQMGFTAQAAFVVAMGRQPRRFSSVALASGGDSTRRYAASVVSPRSSAVTALRRASSASPSADSDR
jgi:ribosomal protein S18 acetylase RimI-like enzyme